MKKRKNLEDETSDGAMFRRSSKLGVRELSALLGVILLGINLSIDVEWYVLAVNVAFILAALYGPTWEKS